MLGYLLMPTESYNASNDSDCSFPTFVRCFIEAWSNVVYNTKTPQRLLSEFDGSNPSASSLRFGIPSTLSRTFKGFHLRINLKLVKFLVFFQKIRSSINERLSVRIASTRGETSKESCFESSLLTVCRSIS